MRCLFESAGCMIRAIREVLRSMGGSPLGRVRCSRCGERLSEPRSSAASVYLLQHCHNSVVLFILDNGYTFIAPHVPT